MNPITVIPKVLEDLLQWIFPPTVTEKLIENETPATILRWYSPKHFQSTHFICVYTSPIIQAAIREHKFHHNEHAADLLSSLLIHWFQQQPTNQFIIPIPLSTKRERERGYNQVTLLAKRVTAIDSRHQVIDTILQRNRHTDPQTSVSKAERLTNVKNAFTVAHGFDTSIFVDQTVVLLDDVLTTGATMAAARATLAPHLPPSTTLICLTIAH